MEKAKTRAWAAAAPYAWFWKLAGALFWTACLAFAAAVKTPLPFTPAPAAWRRFFPR